MAQIQIRTNFFNGSYCSFKELPTKLLVCKSGKWWQLHTKEMHKT